MISYFNYLHRIYIVLSSCIGSQTKHEGTMNPVFITSKDELDAAVHQAVETALLSHLPHALQRATAKPYLTKRELMDLTGWSARQVEYKKSQREIPFIRRGRLVLFPTEEIYAYLDQGYVPTHPSVKKNAR